MHYTWQNMVHVNSTRKRLLYSEIQPTKSERLEKEKLWEENCKGMDSATV